MYLFHKRIVPIKNKYFNFCMFCIILIFVLKKKGVNYEYKESKTVVVIGAGVLSTTFSSMLKELEPSWNIKLYERLNRPGIESSNEAS